MSNENQTSCEIKNFNEFLEKCLDRKVLEYTLKPLTKPGDNYGSTMLSVEVKIAHKSDPKENDVLLLVAKTPVTNPFLVKIFQPALSFVKENRFYSDLIPSIEQLEKDAEVPQDERIDTFIQCIGSRISLDPNAKLADPDAVLMLENIKALDYTIIDRRIGFEIYETQAILKQLAKFHASCIAIRRLQPNIFNSRIKPFLEPIKVNDNPDGPRFINSTCNELRFVDHLDFEWRESIEKQMRACFDLSITTRLVPDSPYTTVVHNDLWGNNMMIKKDNGKPIRTKMYDFQVYSYETFVLDLIFFLCLSVQSEELAQNFHSFIKFYHVEFVKTLKLLNVPLEDYTFEKMWQEIQEKSKMELFHVILFIKMILIEEKTIPGLDTISADNLLNEEIPSDAILSRWKLIFKIFIENEFLRKN